MLQFKLKILNFLIKHLFNSITEDDVLRVSGKNVIIGGVVLNNGERRELVGAAKVLKENFAWKLLEKEMKMACNRMIFLKSNSLTDMIFPRAGLWILDIQKQKIENLMKIPFMPEQVKSETEIR